MKLYVKAKSKADLNKRLASNEKIYGTNHSVFGGGGDYELNDLLETGTVIAIFEREVSGSPYVKAYGTWDGPKHKVK